MRKNRSNIVVANNIETFMKKSPLLDNQSKLSRKSGVAQATIGRILRQETSATIETIDLLAEAFGVEAYCLLSSPEEVEKITATLPDNASEFVDIYSDGIGNLPEIELVKLAGRMEMIAEQTKAAQNKRDNKRSN
jgi:transcriptional regulator with XRE-family HTH domain